MLQSGSTRMATLIANDQDQPFWTNGITISSRITGIFPPKQLPWQMFASSHSLSY